MLAWGLRFRVTVTVYGSRRSMIREHLVLGGCRSKGVAVGLLNSKP